MTPLIADRVGAVNLILTRRSKQFTKAVMQTPETAWTKARNTKPLAEVAKALKISRAAIYAWKRVPAGKVIELETILGLPREQLRPDLYPTRWSDL